WQLVPPRELIEPDLRSPPVHFIAQAWRKLDPNDASHVPAVDPGFHIVEHQDVGLLFANDQLTLDIPERLIEHDSLVQQEIASDIAKLSLILSPAADRAADVLQLDPGKQAGVLEPQPAVPVDVRRALVGGHTDRDVRLERQRLFEFQTGTNLAQ